MKLSSVITRKLRARQFTKATRAEVWELLAALTKSKIAISEALMIAASVYQKRGKKGVYNILLDMRAAIPNNELQKVAAQYAPGGEALLLSGYGDTDTESLFKSMARIAKTELVISRAIKGAIAQPVFVFLLLACVIYGAGVALFPALVELQPLETWPIISKLFAKAAMGFATAAPYIAPVFAVLVAIIAIAVPNYTGGARTSLDRAPPFSFYKLRIGASFILSVIEAGRVGQKIDSNFLYEMAYTASPYARSRITKIGQLLNSVSFGEATLNANQGFPAEDVNTIAAALSTKEGWVENLGAFVDSWLDTVELQAKRSAAILNTIFMLLAAATIGMLLVSIFSILQFITF